MEWSDEQLRKFRIRRAGRDERPPWYRTKLEGLQNPPPRWWVYEPGNPVVVACWGTHKAAVEHVSGLICHRITAPFLKAVES